MSKGVNGSERSAISCLPLEIISYIFKFLPISDIKCSALVCCTWSRAAEDPILWRNAFISLGTRRERFSNVLVDSLQRRCIQYLKFKHMSTAAQIMQVCKQLGPNLKTLSLQGCRCVNASLLDFLSKCCPNIHHLDLSRCRQLDMTKDASWLNDCAIVWRHLTVLDLNACKDISNLMVSKIADTLPMIVNLSISGCKGIKPSIWESLVKKAPSLKFLDISRSDMTDETMHKFSQLPQLNLKGINLTACKQLTDNGLVSFIKYQNSVEILKLACMDITNKTLICIGKHMEHLRVLDLNSCRQLTDAALSSVKSLFVNLESLNLYSCYQLSNTGLSQFLCGLQEINQDIPLRVLVLNGCSSLSDELVSRFSTVLLNLQELDLSSCLHVTDIGLNSVTDSLIQLQSLRLSWCIKITDNGLVGVVQEQKHPQGMKMDQSKKILKGIENLGKLRSLDVSHCTCITDEGIRRICQLKNLTFLNINMCTQITDSGLMDVAESLHSLEHLSFSGCTSITDVGFSSVAVHLERMVTLDAAKCDNITDKSIVELAKHGHNLTHLDLSMCSQITTNAVDQLEISIPGLASLQLRYSGAQLSTKMYSV